MTREILEKENWPEDYIRAVVSHGWGICSDTEPIHIMEKILFTIDELTGLITASVLVRPSKSILDLEVKSVKKKWNLKNFAAGANREVIEKGAVMVGKDLDYIIQETINGMKMVAANIGLAGE
jgi:predicted hydrolase (HD superfamily)